MVALAAGTVVLVPFPFSSLVQVKLRPAVVLADAGRGDWIFCQVTSNPYADPHSVELTATSFAQGSLRITSYARPGKLFTASHELIVSLAGTLNTVAFQVVIESVIHILQTSLSVKIH